jgi:putative ABC transport system permease protein
MTMTLKLAWRNIWRNRRRTVIIVTAIVVGLLGMVYMIAIMDGMRIDMVNTTIKNGVGHIQIHRKGFTDNMNVSLHIRYPENMVKYIEGTPHLVNYAERVKVRGLVSSPEGSSGVEIWGIDHMREPDVSSIAIYLKEGGFLSGEKGEIYIGRSLSEKLEVGLDDKIVLMSQGLADEFGTAAYRVKGIFESTSSEYDKYNVFINISDAQALLFMNRRISEIVIMADDLENVDILSAALKENIMGDYEILTWEEIMPLIVQMVEMFSAFNYIVFLIVIVAMAFGIVNTILMSVLERTREIGILMAIGTKPIKIFSMVMWEGFFLGLVGVFSGWVVSLLIYAVVSRTGIDISIWADSLKYMGGISPILYPIILSNNAFWSTISVLIATFVSSLYPAVKIMRLSPVRAIREA